MLKTKSGFTIVELLIVIVVIAILATISIVAYNGVQERARNSQRTSDIRAIANALELYYADNGEYPMSGGWCTQISNPNNGYATAFQSAISKYMPDVPFDPLYAETNQDYFYRRNSSGQSYHLYAELEGEDRADDGFTGCVRNGADNEYDYRYPPF